MGGDSCCTCTYATHVFVRGLPCCLSEFIWPSVVVRGVARGGLFRHTCGDEISNEYNRLELCRQWGIGKKVNRHEIFSQRTGASRGAYRGFDTFVFLFSRFFSAIYALDAFPQLSFLSQPTRRPKHVKRSYEKRVTFVRWSPLLYPFALPRYHQQMYV